MYTSMLTVHNNIGQRKHTVYKVGSAPHWKVQQDPSGGNKMVKTEHMNYEPSYNQDRAYPFISLSLL